MCLVSNPTISDGFSGQRPHVLQDFGFRHIPCLALKPPLPALPLLYFSCKRARRLRRNGLNHL
jgi:hypothetical protein